MTARVDFAQLPCSDGKHKIGVATLDNPSSLNALTFDMLQQLYQQLSEWHDDDDTVIIWLQGKGEKAFCAGGDVRTMHDVMRDESKPKVQEFCSIFFTLEYQLDYLIHTYSKPIIGWGEGIVMGGGMGLYMGTSHKLVTPTSCLAMPEISIGLYPDVGGTWFLNKLEKGIGLFLGLTGVMVNASDAVSIGLADKMVLSHDKSTLLEQMQVTDWSLVEDSYELVDELLEGFTPQLDDVAPHAELQALTVQIQRACCTGSLNDIYANILAIESESTWLMSAQNNLRLGSPISVHLCYRQLTEYSELSLADCFRLELNTSVRCGLLGEFQEGVRARLIDKDGAPNWMYKSIESVDGKLIDSMFTSLWQDDQHPLSALGHF